MRTQKQNLTFLCLLRKGRTFNHRILQKDGSYTACNAVLLDLPQGQRIGQAIVNFHFKMIDEAPGSLFFMSDKKFISEWNKYVKEYDKNL